MIQVFHNPPARSLFQGLDKVNTGQMFTDF